MHDNPCLPATHRPQVTEQVELLDHTLALLNETVAHLEDRLNRVMSIEPESGEPEKPAPTLVSLAAQLRDLDHRANAILSRTQRIHRQLEL